MSASVHILRKGLRAALIASLLALAAPWAALACNAFSADAVAAAIAAHSIAGGHLAEFQHGATVNGAAPFAYAGVVNQATLAQFVEAIMTTTTERSRVDDDRMKYWDDHTGTIVIYNRAVPYCGTVFRPGSGKSYYDRQ